MEALCISGSHCFHYCGNVDFKYIAVLRQGFSLAFLQLFDVIDKYR